MRAIHESHPREPHIPAPILLITRSVIVSVSIHTAKHVFPQPLKIGAQNYLQVVPVCRDALPSQKLHEGRFDSNVVFVVLLLRRFRGEQGT